ncbi:hypothetical protein HWC35_gp169 [Vibrio phage USC-1]|uniref:Uncharacterized protein n=2 Tax=Aphroditevirus USC1 TaxID=2846605 RepID=A0A514A2R6_9CAUD|nr:hypothetical protein HWC35_gp169 [Vibrio phage USC-1]QCW23165.1 hypothetical protein [Vibrio phage 5 TSL-2019]QDH47563.1 hypothetical protein [Vibrio phage USC-1]
MYNSKQITELLFQTVDAYAKISNNKPHRAVQDLNTGYCYMVATLVQHILKEKFRIDVNMVSHPHHCLLEFEGVYYDTIYPTGYPNDPCKVWKLDEAECRSTLDLLGYGKVGILNPHPRFMVLIEWMCEEFGVSKPEFYNHMVEWYDAPEPYVRRKHKWFRDYTKTTHRRLLTRYRRRHQQYFNEPLTKYSMGWIADFTAYPEDLWVTLRVTDYCTWMRNIIKTRYPSYSEVIESCFGKGVFSRNNIQMMGRLTRVEEPGLSQLRGCIPTVQMIDDPAYQNYLTQRGTVELEMHWAKSIDFTTDQYKLDLSDDQLKAIESACSKMKNGELVKVGDVLTLGSLDKLEDDPKRLLFAIEDNEGNVNYTNDREAWLNKAPDDSEE